MVHQLIQVMLVPLWGFVYTGSFDGASPLFNIVPGIAYSKERSLHSGKPKGGVELDHDDEAVAAALDGNPDGLVPVWRADVRALF